MQRVLGGDDVDDRTFPNQLVNPITIPVDTDTESLGVFREATGRLPRQVQVWSSLAELELKRSRPADDQQMGREADKG